jgi:hypothetical protein
MVLKQIMHLIGWCPMTPGTEPPQKNPPNNKNIMILKTKNIDKTRQEK